MMNNVHLAPSDDDDLYSGFGHEEVAPALQTEQIEYDTGFQAALRTSQRPPGTASGARRNSLRLGTSSGLRSSRGGPSSMGLRTAMGGNNNNEVSRPMTGIRGAGYPGTATGSGSGGAAGGLGGGGKAMFDPLNHAARSTNSPGLDQAREETPEDKIKGLEKKVNELIEESCFASGRGEVKMALDRAKEASTKERSLIRLREQAGNYLLHNLLHHRESRCN